MLRVQGAEFRVQVSGTEFRSKAKFPAEALS